MYWEVMARLGPEILLTLGALAVLGLDLVAMRGHPAQDRVRACAVVTTLSCVVAGFWSGLVFEPGRFLGDMLVIDELSRVVKPALLVMTVLTVWLTVGSEVTEHLGEYFALLLLATVGMLLLASTEHLLMIFVALELLSLSLYVLAAYDKRNARSAEASLKYFLFGGMSAAFLLFGFSLVYGVTGELALGRIAAALPVPRSEMVMSVALMMVVMGFGFKVAAVPFHLWAPDAYQGAPLPSAALIASGSKVASFFIMARVLMEGWDLGGSFGVAGPMGGGWTGLVAVVAGISVVVGNVAALAQRSVRRLLAYSAVAQSGYILVGLLGGAPQGMASVLFYAVTYGLTSVGAFGVVGWVQRQTGRDDLEAFSGLSRRAPFVSFCMLIFLLSLAGIPPLAGFFGKFYLFAAALGGRGGAGMNLLWLVILAVGMSAVSLYYYLQVLKQIYVVEGQDPTAVKVTGGRSLSWAIGLAAVLVVVTGCMPGLVLGLVLPALRAAGY